MLPVLILLIIVPIRNIERKHKHKQERLTRIIVGNIDPIENSRCSWRELETEDTVF